MARQQNPISCRNVNVLAGVVGFYCPAEKLIIELDGNPHGDSIQIRKDMTRDKYLNHPGRESRIVNISKSVIPATPPLKGGETYLSIYQNITAIFATKIFLKLTAMGLRD